jgi:hypothetical protein
VVAVLRFGNRDHDIADSKVLGSDPPLSRAQLLFARPEGMQVSCRLGEESGKGPVVTLTCPDRIDVPTGASYDLRLTNIAGVEGTELHARLDIPRTGPDESIFFAHNAIPIQLSIDDVSSAISGNVVTKVICLPDRRQPSLPADADLQHYMRLEVGIDPIAAANKLGRAVAVYRVSEP